MTVSMTSSKPCGRGEALRRSPTCSASSARWLPGAVDSHMMMTKMIAVTAQVQFGLPVAGRVHGVEVVADRHAHQEDQAGDDPVVLRREGQRIVVRQHQEEHRQRQVVVVRRALLGDLAVLRVGHPPGLQVGDDDLLVRHDDDEDVGRHDRGGEGAEMQQRRAAGEDVRVAPGHRHQDDEEQHHQRRRVRRRAATCRGCRRAASRPRARRARSGCATQAGIVSHRLVDQEEVGAGVIDDAEHREAARARWRSSPT